MSDAPVRILVVDDDFATRLLACEALMAEGFETAEAEDGEEALRRVEETPPAVILLDVNMPGMSGYDVCRALRSRTDGEAFSILMMTASDDVEAVETAFRSGATDFMTKPLNLPLLGRRVRFMLRAAEATRAARDAAHRLTRAQQLAQLVNWHLAADGTFAWESDPYAVLWPEAPAAHPRHSLVELAHPLDRDAVIRTLEARATCSMDLRLSLPDGSERIVRLHAETLGDTLIGATQDITDAKLAEQQIEQLAFYDDLTGIPNRQFLTRYLESPSETQRTAIAIELGTCGMGALVGSVGRDMLVRAATSRVLERIRHDDVRLRLDQVPCAPETFDGVTVVARTGTDELCVVTSATERAASTLRQIADLFARPFAVADQLVTLSPRFGIAAYPDPVDDVREICDRARAAMQEAEARASRNVVAFAPIIDERRRHRDRLAYELSLELDAEEAGEPSSLSIHYERRCTRDGTIVGARPVARWGPVAENPALFADVLASARLANRLSRWTLRRACADTWRWLDAGYEVRMALPVPFQALTALADVLREASLLGRAIDLELTGVAPGQADRPAAMALLEEVRARGVRVVRADLDARTTVGELVDGNLDGVNMALPAIVAATRAELAALFRVYEALRLEVSVSQMTSPAQHAALEGLDVAEISGPLVGELFVDMPSQNPTAPGLFEVRFRSM